MSTIVAPSLTVLLLLAWARPLGLDGLRALHILQLEEYQSVRFWRWLASNAALTVDLWFLGTVVANALGTLALPEPAGLILALVGAAVGAWQSATRVNPPAKKPLVLTARAKRLAAAYVACAILLVVAVGLVATTALRWIDRPVPSVGIALVALGILIWPLASVANLVLYPVEAGYRQYYLWDARRILGQYHPTVIGVAGSYGKTSTKTILAHILSTRFQTLATPRSFNTPMGLCRVIREDLRPEQRFFIAELGAYRRGEIRQLCGLVHPTIGVLTAVGPEHLERFGSMENVVEAENEIVVALPIDGLAIFNGEDDTCRALARKAHCRHVLVAGPNDSARQLWADDVRLTFEGLRFTMCHRDGRTADVQTRLLGRHNVTNILVASAVALECGLAFEDLREAIASLEPVEHRLQLIPNENGVVVIDDTYNSNPRGAAAALEALANFPGGRRYLVTPGMVELADLQDSAHVDFGRQAASVCDAVILIGRRRTWAIAEGLGQAGFGVDRVIVTRNLTEATERLRGLLQRGDTVLFENDLPDNYVE